MKLEINNKETKGTKTSWLMALLLALMTVALYWPATSHDFVNYDDSAYVTNNPHVRAGLTWEGLAWAFGRVHGEWTYWHPLTWVSHMLDCQWHGLNPWGHHLTSVLLHAANVVLLFLVLRGMQKVECRMKKEEGGRGNEEGREQNGKTVVSSQWSVVSRGKSADEGPETADSGLPPARKSAIVNRKWGGGVWPCAMVAALFAVHPLQVDAVAWVAERKTLLSAFFWLLAMGAYVRYAQVRGPKSEVQSRESGASDQSSVISNRSSVTSGEAKAVSATDHRLLNTDYGTRTTGHAAGFYLLSLAFFALGLMCKPVLVTFPFVLLLLDYWPLGRMKKEEGRMQKSESGAALHAPSPFFILHSSFFILEKLPFFILAAASSLITVQAHRALGVLNWIPWDARVENALVSYVRYLGKAFWPCRLAVFYPHPVAWPMWEVITCGLLLLVISGLVLGAARRGPWWFVGWFWFLGVMVPFSGLVQAAEQAMADRFMYVPAIGVMLAVIWGLGEKEEGRRKNVEGRSRGKGASRAAVLAGGAAVLLCCAMTRQQLGHWKNSETLFRHALEVTENNYIAHMGLGTALDQKGQTDEAIRQFQEASRVKPEYADAHYHLGTALDKKGQRDEAIRQFQEALRLRPDYAEAHHYLGYALLRKGQMDEAISHYEEALRLKPDYAEAHYYLGTALERKGQMDEAISEFQQALRLKPDFFQPHLALARTLPHVDRFKDAAFHMEEFLRTCPRANLEAPSSSVRESALGALNDVAWLLATAPQAEQRDGARAVRFAERACELTQYQWTIMVGTLAAAYAEAGRFPEAVTTAQKAIALATQGGDPALLVRNRQLLELYQAGRPYHEPAAPAQSPAASQP